MGAFLLNPPEPCCEPVRSEEIGANDSDFTDCGLCDCVPSQWLLTIDPAFAAPFAFNLGIPVVSLNHPAGQLEFVLKRWLWDDNVNQFATVEPCLWVSDETVHYDLAGVPGLEIAPFFRPFLLPSTLDYPRYLLTYDNTAGAAPETWLILDQAGIQTDPPGIAILGARWIHTASADATSQDAGLFDHYFKCLGVNRFSGWDVASSSIINIKPYYASPQNQ